MKKLLIAAVAALGFAGFSTSASALTVRVDSSGVDATYYGVASGDTLDDSPDSTSPTSDPVVVPFPVPPTTFFEISSSLEDFAPDATSAGAGSLDIELDFGGDLTSFEVTLNSDHVNTGLGFEDVVITFTGLGIVGVTETFTDVDNGSTGTFSATGVVTMTISWTAIVSELDGTGKVAPQNLDISISSDSTGTPVTTIPLPASIVMFLSGLAGLGFMSRKRSA